MKNLLMNVLLKIIVTLVILAMLVWVSICTPVILASVFVYILLVNYDFDNNEVVESEIGRKFIIMALDLLVLPYKWLGVCDNYKEFCQWMGSN